MWPWLPDRLNCAFWGPGLHRITPCPDVPNLKHIKLNQEGFKKPPRRLKIFFPVFFQPLWFLGDISLYITHGKSELSIPFTLKGEEQRCNSWNYSREGNDHLNSALEECIIFLTFIWERKTSLSPTVYTVCDYVPIQVPWPCLEAASTEVLDYWAISYPFSTIPSLLQNACSTPPALRRK